MWWNKAFAAWRLWNFHTSNVPGGKRLVKINIDETRIGYFFTGGKGNVKATKRSAPLRRVLRQRVPKSALRAGITHVAIVCDDPSLQPKLPQVLIANERVIPARCLGAIVDALPDNVVLLRRKSGWNNTELMCLVVELLGQALFRWAPDGFAVLLMDAARIHLHTAVLHACARWGIRVVPVPPHLAWLLQPLDTHVFAVFKRMLSTEYQARCGSVGVAVLPAAEWIDVVCLCIRRCVQGRRWGCAFDNNGFGERQLCVSARVQRGLDFFSAAEQASSVPSLLELCELAPRRSRVDWLLMVQASSIPYSYNAAAPPVLPPRPALRLGRLALALRRRVAVAAFPSP